MANEVQVKANDEADRDINPGHSNSTIVNTYFRDNHGHVHEIHDVNEVQEEGKVNEVAEDKPIPRECPLSNTIHTPTEGNAVNDIHEVHGANKLDPGHTKDPPPVYNPLNFKTPLENTSPYK